MKDLNHYLNEGKDQDKELADYLYKEYIKDAKKELSASAIAYEYKMDTDGKIAASVIKNVIKKYYKIDLK
tara:strand:+ start:16726 stop:16935 length:210 start_codon:yes stop_codon:yes gene_type:complete